jgi:hypothetical protein
MAFAGAAAEAETGAKWSLKDASGKLVLIPDAFDLLPELEVKALENNTASLHFKTAGGTLVEILCTEAVIFNDATGIIRLSDDGAITLGRTEFLQCKTKLNNVLSPPCEPRTTLYKGRIRTLTATGLMALFQTKDTFIEIKAESLDKEGKSIFAHIQLGEECSVGEEVLVVGSLYLKDANNFAEERSERLVLEASGSNLKVLGQPAVITGSARLWLVGAHAVLPWGGLPA